MPYMNKSKTDSWSTPQHIKDSLNDEFVLNSLKFIYCI